jgi:hypothetical protein
VTSGIVLGDTARIPQATQDLLHTILVETPKGFIDELRTALGQFEPIAVAGLALFGLTELVHGAPSTQLPAWMSKGAKKLRKSRVVKRTQERRSEVARRDHTEELPSWFDQEFATRVVSLVLKDGKTISGSANGIRVIGELTFLKLKEESNQEGDTVLVKIDEIVMLRGHGKRRPDVSHPSGSRGPGTPPEVT